jgi:hypothetical protein
MNTTDHLDDLAKEYNRTKDPRIKKLWLKKVKEWANGFDTFKQRRIVSVSSCHKADDGGYIITGRRRLF